MRALPRAVEAKVRSVLALTGLLWIVAGLVLLIPSIWTIQTTVSALAYLLPGGLLISLGIGSFVTQRSFLDGPMSYTDATVGVVAGWLGAIGAASLSLTMATDLTVTQAIFEATSGFTTTGLSVVDVEAADASVLVLRSVMEFAGGAGLAILMVTLLSGAMSGSVPMAEGRDDHLVPDLRRSAAIIVRLYLAYTLAGIFGLRMAGMDGFDAFNHALAAVSTGGFSTKAASIGHWDSLAVEAVTIVLMVLGSTSFLVAHRLRSQGFKSIWDSMDVRLSLVLLPLAVLVVLVSMLPTTGTLDGIRVSVFETVSAWSTTGFSTVGYTTWAPSAYLVMIGLMIVGGGAGSTAGGIKQARVFVLWRLLVWQWRSLVSPENTVERPKYRREGRWEAFSEKEIRSAVNYISLYLLTFTIGCIVFASYGFPIQDSMFEVASTMGTVGLSIGVTSPDLSGELLLFQSALMLLGRLEFFVIGLAVFRVVKVASFVARAED